MIIKDVIDHLEAFAPIAYQEEYDNCGLITGDSNKEVSGILITIDCTEQVVEEAISTGCNLIIAHHPIIFKGIKKIIGRTYIERTIIKAIKHDIALYAIHTNLDNIEKGVNYKIAEKLGLSNVKILAPKKNILLKLVTYVTFESSEIVLKALHAAGAGNIGNYSECSYQLDGFGTFKPLKDANPTIGEQGEVSHVQEKRIEVLLPAYKSASVITALRQHHPYEEPAFDLVKLENEDTTIGSGAIGMLTEPMKGKDFLLYVKQRMSLVCLKHTALPDKPIQKVALCGGSGSFLLPNAIRAGADAYISADFKYHEYFDAENKLVIADIGHYESEVYTKDLLYDFLIEKISNIAIRLSKIDTNPIGYLI